MEKVCCGYCGECLPLCSKKHEGEELTCEWMHHELSVSGDMATCPYCHATFSIEV